MNLNVKKTMLTLLLTSSLMLNRCNVYANNDLKEEGNYYQSKGFFLMMDNYYDSEIIKFLNEGEIVYKLFEDGDYYLVLYNDEIGYMEKAFLDNIYVEESPDVERVNHYKVSDLVETTSKVNFRKEPALRDNRITSINKGEVLEVIAKTENNWYLVKYKDKFGYIYSDYTVSLLDEINLMYPEISLENLKVEKRVYVDATSLNVRNGNSIESKKIGILGKYEVVKVLKEVDGWYFIINNDKLVGYIDKNFTKEIDEKYIVIDLSEQKLWFYNGNDLILSTDIVTGMSETPTRVGKFRIYAKQRDRYLNGEDYSAHVDYWMPFDGGIGLHDASWRKKFGGSIYLTDGSHGCVNMPKDITDDIFEKVEVGTKVLVHK